MERNEEARITARRLRGREKKRAVVKHRNVISEENLEESAIRFKEESETVQNSRKVSIDIQFSNMGTHESRDEQGESNTQKATT